jgi:hypothetical protein
MYGSWTWLLIHSICLSALKKIKSQPLGVNNITFWHIITYVQTKIREVLSFTKKCISFQQDGGGVRFERYICWIVMHSTVSDFAQKDQPRTYEYTHSPAHSHFCSFKYQLFFINAALNRLGLGPKSVKWICFCW